jgi:hypothetical protein
MQLRTNTYPRHLVDRLEPDVGYDVIFVPELDASIAVRSRDEVLSSTCRAIARAGFEADRGPRGVLAAELPLVAPHLLWVNPTAADLSQLRWSLPPSRGMRVRERAPVIDGSAAPHGTCQRARGVPATAA